MEPLRHTTKAQVSGHRFLRRRVEHGLVMGDIRMLYDPLNKRKRALAAGMGMSVLMLAGAGLLAWLAPQPKAGGAAVVTTEQGQIFAQVDGVYHPVPNVVSAQLITGQPAQPVKIAQVDTLGTPAGIPDAPGYLNPEAKDSAWSLCVSQNQQQPEFISQLDNSVEEDSLIVHADLPSKPVSGFALLDSGGSTWLLQRQGVTRMPDGRVGNAVSRALAIDSTTPRWQVPQEFISAFNPLADFWVPEDLPAVWDTGQGLVARSGAGVSPLTKMQADILVTLGSPEETVNPGRAAELPAVEPNFVLPERTADFSNGGIGWLCAKDSLAVVADPVTGMVPLAGTSPATHFGGLTTGGVAVDTGHGRLVVSATGTRHTVGNKQDWEALGLEKSVEVPWPVVRLLPQGTELSRASALS